MSSGYPYSDYHEENFTATEVSYKIGSDGGTDFAADSILLFATEEVYVRFKAGGLQIKIPAGVYFKWDRKCGEIWIQRVSSDGLLKIWAEGRIRNP